MADELLSVVSGDVGDPSADVRRCRVGDDERAMNDGVSLQLAFKLDRVSDGDREFCRGVAALVRSGPRHRTG